MYAGAGPAYTGLHGPDGDERSCVGARPPQTAPAGHACFGIVFTADIAADAREYRWLCQNGDREKEMIYRGILILVLGVGIALAADQEDEQAIRDARAASNAAIAAHDVGGIVGAMDADYQVTASLGAFGRGIDEETDIWTDMFASRPKLLYVRTPDGIEISADYPLAAESGRWSGSWETADGPVRTGGSYAAMWRKVGGAWKIRSELFVALYCEGAGCP